MLGVKSSAGSAILSQMNLRIFELEDLRVSIDSQTRLGYSSRACHSRTILRNLPLQVFDFSAGRKPLWKLETHPKEETPMKQDYAWKKQEGLVGIG